MGGKRQKIRQQLALAFTTVGEGEAFTAVCGGAEPCMAGSEAESQASDERLMETVCEAGNVRQALQRVLSNKGSAGVDGMGVEKLAEHLRRHWQTLRAELLAGNYQPQPVKRVEIAKPDGGVRKLGVPTVQDRFVQQAVLQVLQPQWDQTFSEHSYGFRPGRSAHQAVLQAQSYIADDASWVVDIDLEKFFDRVNHDMLMGRVAKRVADKRVLKLIRGFLNAGVLEDGLVSPTEEGTPQGGPLSPLLSNLVLDDLDQELERCGHSFVRYADDCNIYVSSERAGQRVMASVSKYLEHKLKLRVNVAKSAVGRPWDRSFLGFSFSAGDYPCRRIAPKALKRFKDNVREKTKRTKGRSVSQVVGVLSRYLRGWIGYFGFSQNRELLSSLDRWVRHRLRSLLWKQWHTGRQRYRELRKRGINSRLAAQASGQRDGPWRMGNCKAMRIALRKADFTSLGLPSLGDL